MTVLRENGVHPPICAQCTDAWTWMVRYRDGSELFECQGTHAAHAVWANVDVPEVYTLALLPRWPNLPEVVVHITDVTMRPVFFRRRYIEMNLVGDQSARQTIHCIGTEWQDGTGSYKFVFEDGHVLLTTDRQAV